MRNLTCLLVDQTFYCPVILTYQVAEQGVNLPGFNYIINYHVPSDSASLEQRFGRIDRMDSSFSEIHFVFLISKNGFETDSFNFSAVFIHFLINVLAYLPSRNVIFTKEFVEHVYGTFRDVGEYYVNGSHLKRLLENLTEEMFFRIKEMKDSTEGVEGEYRELASFCIDRDIWLDLPKNVGIEEFKTCVEEEIHAIENVLASKKKISNSDKSFVKEFAEKIDFGIGDKIFYRKCDHDYSLKVLQVTSQSIGKVSAIECGQYIEESKVYQEFNQKFRKMVEVPLKMKSFIKRNLNRINRFFEERFVANDLDSIFEDQSSSLCINRKTLEKCIRSVPDLEKEDCEILMTDYVQNMETRLPIFQFFKVFKNLIRKYLFTEKSSDYEDGVSVFWERLGNQILEDDYKACEDLVFKKLGDMYYQIAVKKDFEYSRCHQELSSITFDYVKDLMKKDGTPLIAESEKEHVETIWSKAYRLRYRKNFLKGSSSLDPFLETMERITKDETFSRLSKKFVERYWNGNNPKDGLFYIEVREGKAVASNWYRLAYKVLQDNCVFSKSIFQYYMENDSGNFRSFVKKQYCENCFYKPFPDDTLTKGICDCVRKLK